MATTKLISSISRRLRTMTPKVDKISLNFGSQCQLSVPARRFSLMSRLPVELSSLETMKPLHSVIASARLRSSLSIESQSWCLVPQGVSMPL